MGKCALTEGLESALGGKGAPLLQFACLCVGGHRPHRAKARHAPKSPSRLGHDAFHALSNHDNELGQDWTCAPDSTMQSRGFQITG